MRAADPWELIKAVFSHRFHTTLGRYGCALISVALAVALTLALLRVGFVSPPFLWYVLAVVVTATFAGFWPGIAASVLSTAVGGYVLLAAPQFSGLRGPADFSRPPLFLIVGIFLTIVVCGRNRARQALLVSEAELNQAQAVAHIGSWHYDIERATLRLSDEACRILGLPTETPVSIRQAWEIVHPDDRDRVNDGWTCALGSGVYEDESRVLVSGQSRWVRVQARVERAADGRTKNAVGTIQDITDRKLAQEALLESEDRYRDLVEHSEDLCCTHDLEGRLLSVNEAPARILGYRPEELLKIPMRDLIIPEGRAPFDDYLDRLRKGSKVETGLLCVITRTGEWRTWEYRNTLRTQGVPAPIVRGMAHDITERRRAELALVESEKRYRSLFEKSVAGVALIAMDGRVMHCNDAWARIFGHAGAEDCFGRNIAECYVDPGERPAPLERLKRGGAFLNDELEMKRNDASRVCLLVSSTLVSDDQDAPMIQMTATDITAHKQAEEALRESEERLWLAQEVAHVGTFDRNLVTGEGRWTPQMEMMYGLKRGSFPRTIEQFVELVHPRDREGIAELVRNSMESGEAKGEWRVQWPDGSVHWISGHWRVFKDGHGNPVRAIGIDYDITERKRSEEALQTSEERFRVALKGSPTAVFSLDRELRYTWIYNFATLTPDQVLGKTDDEILGADNARRMRELKQRVLKTGKGIREEVAISYNGSKFAYDLTLEPLFDSEGKLIGITGAAMDIARLREMADNLAEQRDKLAQEKSYLEGEIEAELGFEEIIGKSPALREVLRKVRIVAPTDSTVLVLGETGTGKELVARALHSRSSRHAKSFIKLNCAAVPSGLLESELFGHEKGAFTGAVNQKLGRLELADGGTLFLDEVGELPLELQPKLLRVLQDREFERLGGVRTIHVNVRIISATNCDLGFEVAEKNFREDLFYRLNVFPISLPSLRDRRSDIPILVSYFVKKYAHRMSRDIDVIPTDTMQVLQNWNWPGNVRELENMIERMVILSKGNVLAAPPVELRMPQETDDNLVEMERDHILRVLRETNGVLAGEDGAAVRLGMKRTTLQSMLKRLGIDPMEYRRGTGTFGRE